MIRTLLGDITTGKLMRTQYLGYSLLLYVLMLGFGFAVVLAIGAGEHIIGGDLQQAQDKLREMFTVPAMLVFAVVIPLFMFMGANIMAKRFRDIGVPGWWMVLVVFILSALVSYFVSENASSGFSLLVWIALLLIPGNVLTRDDQSG